MYFGKRSTPDAPDFYDRVENFANPLHFKKKKGGKHLLGAELEPIVPSEGEIRLLGNRLRQCQYYQVGKFIKE